MPFSALAQTQIKYHSNKYSVQDDIKLGRQAAQEAESQFPCFAMKSAKLR
jgi:hypothetical protein